MKVKALEERQQTDADRRKAEQGRVQLQQALREERAQADADRRTAEQERVRLQQALDRTADSLSSAGAQLQTVQEKLDQTVHWLNYMLRATHFNKG